MSQPATRKISGHTDSVLCCEALPERKLLLSGGEDGRLCFTDLATLGNVGSLERGEGAPVACVCRAAADDHSVYAGAGAAVLRLDLRKGLGAEAVCATFGVNQEEVNALAVNASATWLAAADDSGEVQLINLAEGGGAGGQPQYRTLRRGHSNIASSVAFRPHRPWELLSGGLDAVVVRWDYSRLRPLHRWELSSEATASGGRMFNPPMVHCLAVPASEERQDAKLVAVARGDGAVSVYDGDWSAAAAAAGSSGRKGGKKPRVPPGAASSSSGSSSQAAEQRLAAQATPPAPGPGGRLCVLDAEAGGHTAAVSCVAFLRGAEQLLTGGNDGRVLLWNWREGVGRGAGREEAEQAAAGEPAAPSSSAAGEARGAAGGGGGGGPPLVAADVRHGRKVNWVCACDPAVGGYDLFVADVTKRLTALHLR